jgi:hypothetical protein
MCEEFFCVHVIASLQGAALHQDRCILFVWTDMCDIFAANAWRHHEPKNIIGPYAHVPLYNTIQYNTTYRTETCLSTSQRAVFGS